MPFGTKKRRFEPFNPPSDSFGSYFFGEREREILQHTGLQVPGNVCKFPCNRIKRYLPRRETLCTDLRILRICSRVARWGKIRWCRRTTPILRNALITARSRLDHGSRSAALMSSVMHIKIQRAASHRGGNRVLMNSRAVDVFRSVTVPFVIIPFALFIFAV